MNEIKETIQAGVWADEGRDQVCLHHAHSEGPKVVIVLSRCGDDSK